MDTISEEVGDETIEISNIMNYVLSFQVDEMKNDDDNDSQINVNDFRYNRLMKLINDNHFTNSTIIKQLSDQNDSILHTLRENKKSLNEIEQRLQKNSTFQLSEALYDSNSSKGKAQSKKSSLSSVKHGKYKGIINALKENNSPPLLPSFNSSKFDLSLEDRNKHCYYILKALERKEKYCLPNYYYIAKDDKKGRALYRKKLKEYIQSLLDRAYSSELEVRSKSNREQVSFNKETSEFDVVVKYNSSRKAHFISESSTLKIKTETCKL